MSQIDAQAARENLLPDNRSGASERRALLPSLLPGPSARLPPGEKERNLAESAYRKSRSSYAEGGAVVGGTSETPPRTTSHETRRPSLPSNCGVPFSLGTRVTDLENNTKPQLPPHFPLPPLLKHHFVTNEAPNSESDSVPLGGRFLPSPPSP